MGSIRQQLSRLATLAFCGCLLALSIAAESSDQNFPTAVTTNEINGTIKARDIGDARQTRYFYAFDGGQGDIFINVVAKNFSGDIDIFTADAFTPLTKMVLYADADQTENGRLIYLRKPERLILRVEGRTPNDDPATFRIKFGGSFIALAPQKQEEAPTVAKAAANEPGVKVDSVGRIVAIVPKPQPTPKAIEPPPVKEPSIAKEKPKAEPAKTVAKTTPPSRKRPADTKKTETVYENKTAKVTVEPAPPERGQPARNTQPGSLRSDKAATAKKPKPAKPAPKKPEETAAAAPGVENPDPSGPPAKPVDALASIRLVIQMKDGTVFWLPMNKVAKFTVDKGVMTVTAKDGSVTRYNILDVEKTTIQ